MPDPTLPAPATPTGAAPAGALPIGAVPTGADAGRRTTPPGQRLPVLDVEGLGVRLGGRQVLSDVSFHLCQGEVAGLIGSNGAGKTTLLRAVLGLTPVSAGHVSVAGSRGRRPPVGYVPQKVVLDPDLPIRARDLVQLGQDGHRWGLPWPSAAKRAATEELLAGVGALHLADARVGQLSGGELQRVLVAHALAGGPRLLLLDEPLANLDLRSARDTVALLDCIARQQGIAVLMSTHDVNPLMGVMDRVVYLAGGRAATGPTADVVRSDVLSSLYGHHVDVLHAHGRVIVSIGDDAHRDDGCDAVPASAGVLADEPEPSRSGWR